MKRKKRYAISAQYNKVDQYYGQSNYHLILLMDKMMDRR
jgi:hypothetical protein